MSDLTDIHPDYDAENTTETEPTMTETPAAETPVGEKLDPSASESPALKRQKLMGGAEYKQSAIHQIAAQTWATVEVREAIDEQTKAIREQVEAERARTEVARERNELAREQLDETSAQLATAREQVAETRALVEATREQIEAVAWNAQMVQAQVGEMRSQSQMQFYAIRHLLPDGIREQMQVNLGITGPGVSPAPAPVPEPADLMDFT